MLKFFGRGSAFADEHNSAFFTCNREIVLIDCPATAFQKVKRFDFGEYDNIYVLVTHTHGDHAGGIGTLLQFLFFAVNKQLTVIAPSEEVYNDLTILLKQIEGCEQDWFNIITADNLNKDWFVKAIPVQHAEPLKDKCFGYLLNINGNSVVYTGDTKTLEPFLPYLKKGSYLYTEISYYKSKVHLYYEDTLPVLLSLTEKGIKVFLMHLDNEEKIAELIYNTNLRLAPIYISTKEV